MSHKHQVTLQKIFDHPISSNIDWKKLQNALKHYGADIKISKSNKAHIKFNDNQIIISEPHHGHEINHKNDIIKLRHFLEENAIKP